MADMYEMEVSSKAVEKKRFDIDKAREEYSDKKAYIEGIKYYHNLIASEKVVRHDENYAKLWREFREKMLNFEKFEYSADLKDMSALLAKCYPEGQIDKIFVTTGLQFALDGASEYLMHLKKLYFVKD